MVTAESNEQLGLMIDEVERLEDVRRKVVQPLPSSGVAKIRKNKGQGWRTHNEFN